MRAFADALEEIPLALAENSGFSPIDYVSKIKQEQITEKDPFIGVDALGKGITNMMEQSVLESAASKKNQLELATQVVKMILKIDDVISPSDFD